MHGVEFKHFFPTHFYSDYKLKQHSERVVNASKFEYLSYVFLKDSFVPPTL